MNAPQGGAPVPKNVGDKLKSILADMESGEPNDAGTVELKMKQNDASMWTVSYSTTAMTVE